MENFKKFKTFIVLSDSNTDVRLETEIACNEVDVSNLLNFSFDSIAKLASTYADDFLVKAFYVEFLN